jgi:hypothetical protein
MMRMNKKYFFILIILFAFALSIYRGTIKTVIKVDRMDSTIHPIKVSIEKLVKDYKNYHSKYIETSGEFHYAFEDFSIADPNANLRYVSASFWLNTNEKLNVLNSHYNKAQNKRIRIKGRIDTSSKGHLSSYLATITDIYYFQY